MFVQGSTGVSIPNISLNARTGTQVRTDCIRGDDHQMVCLTSAEIHGACRYIFRLVNVQSEQQRQAQICAYGSTCTNTTFDLKE